VDDALIEIAEYDPCWVEAFRLERQVLCDALARWLVGMPEHIGSTAVPGLAAKPIIDIMAPVRSLQDSRAAGLTGRSTGTRRCFSALRAQASGSPVTFTFNRGRTAVGYSASLPIPWTPPLVRDRQDRNEHSF
jgi:hypothetical protein